MTSITINARRLFAAMGLALAIWACSPAESDTPLPVIHKTDSKIESENDLEIGTDRAGVNAIFLSAGTLNVTNCKVSKSGDGLNPVENAAVAVSGTGWLVMKGSSVISNGACSPAIAVTGGKAEGAVKIGNSVLLTSGKNSPAIYIGANSIMMDGGQMRTAGDTPAIYVPAGSEATLDLNGVACECPVLAEVYGTLHLNLGQYGGSKIQYTGTIKNEGKILLDDQGKVWQGTVTGSGTFSKEN